jgi:hypothetical protein
LGVFLLQIFNRMLQINVILQTILCLAPPWQ